MDELKQKFKKIIHKQENVKIPTMGFSEYYFQNVSIIPGTYQQQAISVKTAEGANEEDSIEFPQLTKTNLSDQEILESTEDIYFQESVNTGIFEMKKFTTSSEFNCTSIEKSIAELKQQHKVISKKVLQLILEQRSSCNEEFKEICNTDKKLKESINICQHARSCLKSAKKQLTTTSLEILATYKKREILLNLLKILKILKKMKTTDQELQVQLECGNYSGAIAILLENKLESEKLNEYSCVESLTLKLQDTLIITEVQLDNVLNEIPSNFDLKKYSKLQEAYKLLGKTTNAMDQLHMNFISAIHTTAFSSLKIYVDLNFDEQKLLFEQLCEKIPTEKYIPCLINLCKGFWRILVSYHQVITWHNNFNLAQNSNTNMKKTHDNANRSSNIAVDSSEYLIDEKLKKGQYRLWNDIQLKICLFLANSKLNQLKYDNFIQVLSIIQRLKKVGFEFCEENSEKLMSSIRSLSMDFFKRYHISCLEEVNLFLDHEVWIQIDSFTKVTQLQEFRTVKRTLKRHKICHQDISERKTFTPNKKNNYDNDSSAHSQDESSIFGSCGYFLRFSEKSSPFDGGFDESMLEEDILAGIADESSCYYSDESDDESNDDPFNNNNINIANSSISENTELIYVSNTSLTVLRCIGRYLQMCRLLHSIAPFIVASMTELIDFYIFAVHEMFGKDLPVSGDNLYSNLLTKHLQRISNEIIIKVKKWPPSMGIINEELKNPDQLYGLTKRLIGVESCISLIQQFEQLRGYLEYLLPGSMEKQILNSYFIDTKVFVCDLRKPIYMCVTARVIDVSNILSAMAKTKWDINHVTVEYSPYVNIINRGVQLFAMRLEEISKTNLMIPKEPLWDCLAHIITHMLVEGFSNAKKCTYGGRTLMQLDFTHFISILELISGAKHQKHKDYVEQYVKAYYLPKDLLENWIVDQKKSQIYSNKHLTGLIQCACANDKKLRHRILGIIDGTTINFQTLNNNNTNE